MGCSWRRCCTEWECTLVEREEEGEKNGRKKVLGEKENNEDNDEGERGWGG